MMAGPGCSNNKKILEINLSPLFYTVNSDLFENYIPTFIYCFLGSPCDPTSLLSYAPCNVICSIIFQNRFEYSDENFLTLAKYIHENAKIVSTPWIEVRSTFSLNKK